MTEPSTFNGLERLRALADRLKKWLVAEAYPRWAEAGVDRVLGGFEEKIGLDGKPVALPRRARVQTRQVFSYAQAPAFGWTGDSARLVRHGLDYFLAHYRRADGLFRTMVAPNGDALDDRAFLYDQAFALLAFAESQKVLGSSPGLVTEGRRLRDAIRDQLTHPEGGFASGDPDRVPLLSNPHMHLFEACHAWIEISDDPEWRVIADGIADLALRHFIDSESGALRESFDADWLPVAGLDGRIVEPGHQFEWAWLLNRWAGQDGDSPAAARLIAVGEGHGIHNHVAINALLDDLSIHDAATRLWPQTEWLKATVQRAGADPAALHWSRACDAAEALLLFLDTDIPGLWRDRRTADGNWIEEPAPASSFYHIIVAIAELSRVLADV